MEGFELIRLKGISLRVNSSCLLILLLFTLASQGQISRDFEGQLPLWQIWFIGFLTAFLLFLSVALYELGHSLMALYEGVQIKSINLFFLGGLSRVNTQCSNPLSNLRIAFAGPFISLLIGTLSFLVAKSSSLINPLLINMLIQIGGVNLVLAFFNLLPTLPLDGGIIIKSLVWYFSGSQKKGHKLACNIGRIFSLFLLFLGGISIFRGGGLNGILLIILGWFSFASSKSQDQIIILQETLSELSVKDVSNKHYRIVDESQKLEILNNQLNINATNISKKNEFYDWTLLFNSGRWTGFVKTDILQDVPMEYWGQYSLSGYKKPLSDLPSISENFPLWCAVLKLEKTPEKRLLVFNLAGLPSGTIDKADIGQIALKKLGVNLPRNFVALARKQNVYPLGISLKKVVDGMISSGLIKQSELDQFTK